jgi:hypothetical protein
MNLVILAIATNQPTVVVVPIKARGQKRKTEPHMRIEETKMVYQTS